MVYSKHALTGDIVGHIDNPYDPYDEIAKYIEEYNHPDYTIAFCDNNIMSFDGDNILNIENKICEIGVDELLKLIGFIMATEKTGVKYIGCNKMTDTYVLGINFMRRRLSYGDYKIVDGKLVMLDNVSI